MKLLKLVFKNAFRHKLRTYLTILGLAVTIMSFGIVRNILEVFSYSDSDLVPGHMICRHKTSVMQFLPMTHIDKIRQVDGVKYVTYSFWVGMKYGENPEDFFMRMAVDPENFALVRTDWRIPDESLDAFKAKINAALITPALALKKGWENGQKVTVGWDYSDQVSIDVEVAGQFEFKNEQNAQLEFMLIRADQFQKAAGASLSPEIEHQVGWIELIADPPKDAADVGMRVDSLFANSNYETKTESVNAYADQQVERFSTIINALRISSYLMIIVILLVLLNTMTMIARERISENAVLKTLGFRTGHLVLLNFGESMLVALIGAVVGGFLIWPGVMLFKQIMPFLQQVSWNWETLYWVGAAMLIIGVLASIAPIVKAVRTTIVDGLRTME